MDQEKKVWIFFQELWEAVLNVLRKFIGGGPIDTDTGGQPGNGDQNNNSDIEAKLRAVAKGVTGDQTVILGQSYLRVLEFPIGASGPNRNGVDGVAGSITCSGLKLFQKINHLEVNGQFDSTTMASLKKAVYERQTFRTLVRTAGQEGIDLQITSGAEKADFVYAVHYYAILDEIGTLVPAAVTTAQAILESDYGKAIPVDQATGRYSYNLFGIKGVGPAGSVQAYSWEENSNGTWEKVMAQFEAYVSFADSVQGHSQFLIENKRYAPAFKTKTPQEFAKAIAAAGYATDSKYAAKLISVMDYWGLI